MTAMMAVRMLGAHDHDWFRGVYSETYRPLLAYARRRVDHATADEVVADTFFTAWRRRDDVPDGSERLWLFGVARNMIRNAARSNWRRQAAHDRLRIANPPEAIDNVADAADDRSTMLRTALGSLSEADREVLMLVAWEELSHAEIGQVLGISANASAIRVHRARKRLAARLEHLEHLDHSEAGESNAKELRRHGQAARERPDEHQPERPDDDSARKAQ
ncbi:RNA polymerase sigma factor [Candidatus Poriferisodalis sp.]|uniref:RNA polymerase sigma factor n=1 Tax=Candidatus Poriferisodalis sp. TaxID=3101277 RepID=UPI003C704C29